MDEQDELQKLKWLLGAVIVFLVSGWYSWGELNYAVRGTSVEATLVRVYETVNASRRGRHMNLAVEYEFQEPGGTTRKETDEVAIDTPRPEGPKVAIQYIPGKPGASRLDGHSNMVAVVVFVLALAWLSWQGYALWREAREATSPRKSSKTRRRGG